MSQTGQKVCVQVWCGGWLCKPIIVLSLYQAEQLTCLREGLMEGVTKYDTETETEISSLVFNSIQ